MAELATDPKERAEWLTFVVIGAGPDRRRAGRPAGRTRAQGAAAGLPHGRTPHEARILMLEGAPAVLPPFNREAAEVHPGAAGEDGRRDPAQHPGHRHGPRDPSPSRARTGWRRSAPAPGSGRPGVQASPLAKMLAEKTGAETDRAGRVPVQPRLQRSPGTPRCSRIGDMVLLNKLPGVAQPAMQEGKYVGKLIKAQAAGRREARAVQVLRQGQHGHHRAQGRRRRRVRHEVHRRSSGTSCGASSTCCTWSAGATGSARSTPGAGRSGSPTTAGTGSSRSSRRTIGPRRPATPRRSPRRFRRHKPSPRCAAIRIGALTSP